MPYIDFILLSMIGGFALFGLWFGLVSTVGSIIGSVAGIYLASRFYMIPAAWLIKFTGWTGNFPKFIAFIIGFLVINRLVGLAFYVLDKALFLITSLPVIHGLNKLLGLIFGIVEGVIVVGISLYFFQKFPFWPPLINQISISKVAPLCINLTSFLWPLLPDVLKMVSL